MGRPLKLSSSYPDYAAASIGGLTFPSISVVNQAAAQQSPNQNAQLGDILVDKFGCRFQFVRTVAGLAVGQAVKAAANLTGTITAAGSSTSYVKTSITTTVDESSVGSFLTSPGTTVFTRLIKKQSAVGANTIFYVSLNQTFLGNATNADGDILGAVPTNGEVIHVVRPFAVDVAGAGAIPVGVALGTVTSGYRTLIQIEGPGIVSGIGSTDAIVDNGIITTAASGNVKGATTAALTADDVLASLGQGKMAHSGGATLIAAYINPAGRF